MKKSILVIMFSLIAIATIIAQGEEQKSNNAKLEPAPELQQLFTDALQGKNIPELRKSLSPEAYVIYDNTYESIFEVLNSQAKRDKFFSGKEPKTGFVHIRTSEDEKMAYMVAEVKSSDGGNSSWNSILFKMNNDKKWQIVSWHKS